MLTRDWAVLLVGTALGVVALTADLLGIGGYPGFGWKQAAAAVVALLLVILGAVGVVRREGRPPS